MKAFLQSSHQEFDKELLDVAMLFTGPLERGKEGEECELRLLIHQNATDQRSESEARIEGLYQGYCHLEGDLSTIPLLNKRERKRQAKMAVYGAFRQAGFEAPPWGALTGVRPARLVFSAMQEEGLGFEAACEAVRRRYEVSLSKTALLKEVVLSQMALPEPKTNEVDWYVGIPFCVSRCRYCSFISSEVGDGQRLRPYLEALKTEIKGAEALMKNAGLSLRALYIGGGTPTALPEDLLSELLNVLKPLSKAAAEVTVEAGRPDTLNRNNLSLIRDFGAARISINPQTMHNQTLERIGRRHTRFQTEEAYRLARELGFSHINMDLIMGLPGETLQMFEETLAWAEALAPESLTVHALALKRSSDMYRYKEESRAKEAEQMADRARQSAKARGLVPYYLYRQKHMAGNQENVGYALPGHACLYNVDMMEDGLSVLALGAGGISKRVSHGGVVIERSPNVKNIDHYIDRIDEMIARKQALFSQAPSPSMEKFEDEDAL